MTTREKRSALGKLVTAADRARAMRDDPGLVIAITHLAKATAELELAMQAVEKSS